jgi:hypothetical protein
VPPGPKDTTRARILDDGLIEAVWDAVRSYGPERAEREARAFIDRQPHLVALAEAMTQGFAEDVCKTALGLVYLVAKLVEAEQEAPLPAVSATEVDRAYRSATARLGGTSDGEGVPASDAGAFSRPELIPALVLRFRPPRLGHGEEEAEVRGRLVVLLRAAADALSRAAGGQGGPWTRSRRRVG